MMSKVVESVKDVFEYIHFTLPCYYTQRFKTKADKSFLVGMNWYRNAHFGIKNEVKTWYTDEILRILNQLHPNKITGHYELAFEYYYKNSNSDLGNVCSLASKHANDAFQKYGLVENDNVKFCVRECYHVGGQDKTNPRIEVFVREVKDEDEC